MSSSSAGLDYSSSASSLGSSSSLAASSSTLTSLKVSTRTRLHEAVGAVDVPDPDVVHGELEVEVVLGVLAHELDLVGEVEAALGLDHVLELRRRRRGTRGTGPARPRGRSLRTRLHPSRRSPTPRSKQRRRVARGARAASVCRCSALGPCSAIAAKWPRSTVALVARPSRRPGVASSRVDHEPVAVHLGDDGCRGDRRAVAVGLDPRGHARRRRVERRAEPVVVAVEQHDGVRRRRRPARVQRRERARAGEAEAAMMPSSSTSSAEARPTAEPRTHAARERARAPRGAARSAASSRAGPAGMRRTRCVDDSEPDGDRARRSRRGPPRRSR